MEKSEREEYGSELTYISFVHRGGASGPLIKRKVEVLAWALQKPHLGLDLVFSAGRVGLAQPHTEPLD